VLAADALAADGPEPAETVVVATASGLAVRAPQRSVRASVSRQNVLASAINTEGVSRATHAVRKNGRVLLRASGPPTVGVAHVADPEPAVPNSAVRRKAQPQGLGTLLARLFGQA
jgi:hypothetical protein